jgi:hypothetical protein
MVCVLVKTVLALNLQTQVQIPVRFYECTTRTSVSYHTEPSGVRPVLINAQLHWVLDPTLESEPRPKVKAKLVRDLMMSSVRATPVSESQAVSSSTP